MLLDFALSKTVYACGARSFPENVENVEWQFHGESTEKSREAISVDKSLITIKNGVNV